MNAPLSVFRLHDILAELWRARGLSGSSASPGIATLNFIVFIDDPEHHEAIRRRAVRIAEKHPSRLIILNACDMSDAAEVTTTAVELAVGTLDACTIATLVQELSVRDIPTVLWWTGRSFVENPIFQALADQTDRVVVDSSGNTNDESALRELLRFPQSREEKAYSLRDLAWMRLAPWQEMIAQFFDDPDIREDLASLTSLEIASGSAAEALYLAGWLASRLGWAPADGESFQREEGSRITFERHLEGEMRRVVRVALVGKRARYTAQLSADEHVVELRIQGRGIIKSPWFVPLQNIDNASLIERAILAGATDEIFESSLRTIHELLA